MPGITIGLLSFFVLVWFSILAFQHWHPAFLNKAFKIRRRRLVFAVVGETSKLDKYVPRKFESFAFLLIALCAIRLAFHLSNFLLLCYLYGVSRVLNNGLHFVEMPKGHPWILSNGDQIQPDVLTFQFVLSVFIWLSVTIVGFVLIRKLLPIRAEQGVSTNELNPASKNCAKHLHHGNGRVKGFSFRNRALLFFFGWLAFIVFISVIAHWIGHLSIVIGIIAITSMVILVAYFRSDQKHLMSVIQSTHCPQCGMCPMRFEPRSASTDHPRLICDKCKTECNLTNA